MLIGVLQPGHWTYSTGLKALMGVFRGVFGVIAYTDYFDGPFKEFFEEFILFLR